jgi:hypothetical protein
MLWLFGWCRRRAFDSRQYFGGLFLGGCAEAGRFPVGLAYREIDFVTMHCHLGRSLYADPYLIAIDGEHGNLYVLPDDDYFLGPSGKHEHLNTLANSLGLDWRMLYCRMPYCASGSGIQ